MKILKIIMVTISSMGLLLLGACTQDAPQKLTIATAANMKTAMEVITSAFAMETGIECDLVVSSSGKLTAQIQEGAPFDVFASANMKYPESLHEAGLTDAPPTIYARGKLALWTYKQGLLPNIMDLVDSSFQYIAIANPQNAPYGQAAKEALINFGIWDEVQDKLVYGESIAQTNQFIVSGAADIGFTAKSIVLTEHAVGQGSWLEIDDQQHQAIQQGVVVIKNSERLKEAKQFQQFMLSNRAKGILQNFGYETD